MTCIRDASCNCGGAIVARKDTLFELNDPPLSRFVCAFCARGYDAVSVCGGDILRVKDDCICVKCGRSYGVNALTRARIIESIFAI